MRALLHTLTAVLFIFLLTACIAGDGRDSKPALSLNYIISVDPSKDQVKVIGEWKGGISEDFVRLGDGDTQAMAWRITHHQGATQFSYKIAIPERREENVLLVSLSNRRIRAILQDILYYPKTAVGPVQIEVDLPQGWQSVTTAGDPSKNPVIFSDIEAASYSPLFGGDLRITTISLDDGVATLAVRQGHPVPDEYFQLGFQKLIEEAAAYTRGKDQPRAVLFGIDLLEGKFSSVPGVNFATKENSASLVLQSNDDPRDKSFWGTISHEVLHGWIPRAFRQGDRETEIPRWFGEGVTNHIGYEIAFKAGLIDQAGYISRLEKSWQEYATYEEGDEDPARAYSEGHLIGFATAVIITHESGGVYGFEDFFQSLLERYGADKGGSFSRENYILAVEELGGRKAASIARKLTSNNPDTVRSAFSQATKLVGLDISVDGTISILSKDSAVYNSLFFVSSAPERATTLADLNSILDQVGPLVYPLRPSLIPRAPALTNFSQGLASPIGNSWKETHYGADSSSEIALIDGVLRVEGKTGPSFTGAGVSLQIGTADETINLSGFKGIELDIDVQSGPVVLQIPSAVVGRRDIPFAEIGPTDGRTKRIITWEMFHQYSPIVDWEKHANEIQIMVRGQGIKDIKLELYGAKLVAGN